MVGISASLVKSLNDLGLSNYEASVYAALVLYDNAEAKDLVGFLSISKPSVYEALDHLAEMGLAVKRVSKPARYSAVSPEMAIDLLMGNHKRAAHLALEGLKKLETEKVPTDKEDALWTIYGDANIGYKIRDLFRKAKSQITCIIGERYLPCIERCNIGNVSLRLIVISDSPDIERKLHEQFPGKNADLHVVSSEKFMVPPPFAPPEFVKAHKFMNFANTLELIVDDEEILMIPPFVSGSVSVLNTRNKGTIFQMKLMSQLNWKRLIDGEEYPFPPPPQKKKRAELKK
ncbi:TrmB family transcriptional regulator [Methanoregula sp.]|jgi:sugar-specific transcriptional regulator TrmB|uniref:TrmB family transcriptional regulator n=1 Tax=Methanoregula sp. TaxID=2052170 RepID=UPI0025ED18B5|nr:helix-turn-helix domain-containing protein [Methanoregula sp.]